MDGFPKINGRALLAEDEPLVATMLAEMLLDLGFDPTVTNSGLDAIAALKSDQPFDLVITDFSMPGANGKEVFCAVRERYPKLPVLYVTGYDAADVFSDVDQDMYLHILQKPFGTESMRHAIESLLKG